MSLSTPKSNLVYATSPVTCSTNQATYMYLTIRLLGFGGSVHYNKGKEYMRAYNLSTEEAPALVEARKLSAVDNELVKRS